LQLQGDVGPIHHGNGSITTQENDMPYKNPSWFSDADLYFSRNTFLEAQGAQKLVTFSHKLVTICTWLAEFHQNPMGTFCGFCNSWHSD